MPKRKVKKTKKVKKVTRKIKVSVTKDGKKYIKIAGKKFFLKIPSSVPQEKQIEHLIKKYAKKHLKVSKAPKGRVPRGRRIYERMPKKQKEDLKNVMESIKNASTSNSSNDIQSSIAGLRGYLSNYSMSANSNPENWRDIVKEIQDNTDKKLLPLYMKLLVDSRDKYFKNKPKDQEDDDDVPQGLPTGQTPKKGTNPDKPSRTPTVQQIATIDGKDYDTDELVEMIKRMEKSLKEKHEQLDEGKAEALKRFNELQEQINKRNEDSILAKKAVSLLALNKEERIQLREKLKLPTNAPEKKVKDKLELEIQKGNMFQDFDKVAKAIDKAKKELAKQPKQKPQPKPKPKPRPELKPEPKPEPKPDSRSAPIPRNLTFEELVANDERERKKKEEKKDDAYENKDKEDEPEEEEQTAQGRGKELMPLMPADMQRMFVGLGEKKDEGLSNIQIDKVMKKYKEYLGTIARDQIKPLIIPKVKPQSRGAFIMNTDPSYKEGKHWVAVFFDARPSGSLSVEYYNSFADPIPADILKDLKLLVDKLKPSTYLKFKENKVKQQDDRTSNCGYFAMRFIIDRFRGKSFAEATGYNDAIINKVGMNEKEIEKLKEQAPFKYI